MHICIINIFNLKLESAKEKGRGEVRAGGERRYEGSRGGRDKRERGKERLTKRKGRGKEVE